MVKKFAMLFLALAFVFGCTGNFQVDQANLQQFTVADLQQAKADADAHNDVAASQCYGTLLTVITTGLPQLPPKPIGAVSAFQALRDLIGQGPGQADAIAKQINIGCAALFVDANVTMGKLLLELGVKVK